MHNSVTGMLLSLKPIFLDRWGILTSLDLPLTGLVMLYDGNDDNEFRCQTAKIV